MLRQATLERVSVPVPDGIWPGAALGPRRSRPKLKPAQLAAQHAEALEGVILAAREQAPAEHTELACHRYRGDLAAATGGDACRKGKQRAGATGRHSGRFDELVPGRLRGLLGETSAPRGRVSRMAHARVQPQSG